MGVGTSCRLLESAGEKLRRPRNLRSRFSRTLLLISDNGRGFDPEKTDGSGLKLIRALARQIAGQVEQETSGDGTITRITFIDGN